MRYAVIFLLIATGILHFRAAFFAQLAQNHGPYMTTFSHSLTHPDALADLARDEHLRNADLSAALSLYKKALANFVLHLPSWFGLAEVLNDMGKEKEAIDALEFIHVHFKNSEDITWSKTLLASTLGQEQILTENLIWLANNSPSKRNEVFALATLAWDDPDVVMNKFGTTFYVDILNEYIKNDAFEKTMTVWDQIVKSGSIQEKYALQYVNYLVGQNAFLLARKVWNEAMGETESPLYNGNFEKPIQGSGFGWRIPKTKGVSWKQGDYGSGLEVTFDGTENAVLQLSQILPLEPGEYILSGSVETDDLTTDQLPFWRVQGFQCTGLSVQSEMVLPNQHPTDFVLPFFVPDSCELVRIALIRKASLHFDNKISGKITVNNLNIREKGELSSTAAQSMTPQSGTQKITQTQQKKTATTISPNKLIIRP